jgi:hypothetical protein
MSDDKGRRIMASRPAIAALAALLLATGVSAVAQTNPASSQAAKSGTNRPAPIRIQTQTQFVMHGAGAGTLEDQRLMQESLRRAIYETAAKECEILNSVFHGECHLVMLNANSNPLDRMGNLGNDGASGNGGATFEIIPRAD